jgi:hypothetical protein
MTYATLQTGVADYLHRTDLTSKMPTFVTLAESVLFRELSIRDMAVSVDLTTTGEYCDLPADFGDVVKLTVTYGSTETPLDYKSPPYSWTGTSHPESYTLESNQLRIFGAGTGFAFKLYYTPKIQALSDVNTTNWLLENAYDLYFYAVALEAAKWTRDQAEEAKLSAVVGALLDSVRRASERKGLPATASLQIKPRR